MGPVDRHRPPRWNSGSFIITAFLLLAAACPTNPDVAYMWAVKPAPGVHQQGDTPVSPTPRR